MPNLTLAQTSVAALENSFLANLGFILFGTPIAVINFLELYTIAKDKKLHTRCYFLIANYCVAAIVYSLSFAIIGVKRVIRLQLNISEVAPKWICNLEMITAAFGQAGTVALPMATAIDRLMAAGWPMVYSKMDKNSAVFLAVFGWTFALVDSAMTFKDDQSVIVTNCNLASTTSMLFEIQNATETTISALVTLIYIIIIVSLKRQLQKAQMMSENIILAKRKMQMRVAKTLAIDSGVHLVTQVVTRLGFTLMTPLTPEARFAYGPFLRLIVVVGCGANFIIFVTLNKEFYSAFRRSFKSFGCSDNSVIDIRPSHVPTSYVAAAITRM